MALDRFGAEVFLLLKRRGIQVRRLLTLGRQHFTIPRRDIATLHGLADFIADCPESNSGPHEERFADAFFHALGTETVDSLDASDYENCTLVHDLNEPIPESWHAKYDIVFDGGTLEHVFHFPNAIANAMSLVNAGGVLFTQSPSNNLNGHGFYQFSPELIFRLFDRANGFRLLLIALVESDWPHRIFRVEDPESIGSRVTFGGEGPLQLIAVARREEVRPVLTESLYQSDYSANWSESCRSDEKMPAEAGSQLRPSAKQQLRKLLPHRWLARFDQNRYRRFREKIAETGIAKAASLDACFSGNDKPEDRTEPMAGQSPRAHS